MRGYTREARVEKEKKQYKDQMWSKVNNWLHDFDKKTSNIINEIDKQPKDSFVLEQSLDSESMLIAKAAISKDSLKYSMFDTVADDKENNSRLN